MIRVNKDYVIEIDSLNYTVKRDLHRKYETTDRRTGEKVETDGYSNIGYYSDFTSAIKGVIADMNKRALSAGVHDLKEAVEIVLENNRHVSELLEKALEI